VPGSDAKRPARVDLPEAILPHSICNVAGPGIGETLAVEFPLGPAVRETNGR